MIANIVSKITGSGGGYGDGERKKIRGSVVLMKKNVLDFSDFSATILDGVRELTGKGVSLRLVSAENADPTVNGVRGKVGEAAYLENWNSTTLTGVAAGESRFGVTFDWDEGFGVPGAVIIRNDHHYEFYLKTLTLEDFPDHGRIHFVCNSWVYPAQEDRIFFVNKACLPHDTPLPLIEYRNEELVNLRGDGTGERQEWERIYDYAFYNDLGDPDKGQDHARPVLGGSADYPYPRRGRTGRAPTKSDPNTESRLPIFKSLDIYVPVDERFGHVKVADAIAYALKALSQVITPALQDLCKGSAEFQTFDDVLQLYEGGIKLPKLPIVEKLKNLPLELIKELVRSDGEQFLKFPMPQVIKEDRSAWRTDEEFGREMLAGLNPFVISLLKEFPPKSKLDKAVYGDQNSSITEEHIRNNLDGLTVDGAMEGNRLFILDHHDKLMPYLRRINSDTSTKAYASRTLFFLRDDGTLKPVSIELSLPHPDGDQFGAVSKVYTPAEHGVEGSIWQLAKAYVAINDSGYHQLISHWLHTHAVMEPFVIATRRQLSVLHPVYKLLDPHFRDTMNINALSRQILINAGGFFEATIFSAKYAFELSSMLYKDWDFNEQALPADLKKRGIAVEDPNAPHGLRLLIEDYPYAVDGLEIWSAIREWVAEYCSFYYKSDEMVRDDTELQSWWKEVREEGHGDLKEKDWWPKMQTKEELIESCTIVIWIGSALHAAVNFGQYSFAGYFPNRPTISRRFMPEEGSLEYEELKSDPDKAFFKTVTPQLQALLGISLIEILSRHPSDEVYLGQRDNTEWTSDAEPLKAFEEFGKKLANIEDRIMERNKEEKLKNRAGPVKMPYTLLVPSSEVGLTGRGIPNSISI